MREPTTEERAAFQAIADAAAEAFGEPGDPPARVVFVDGPCPCNGGELPE
jgi:hypothetical protein